MEKFKYLE